MSIYPIIIAQDRGNCIYHSDELRVFLTRILKQREDFYQQDQRNKRWRTAAENKNPAEAGFKMVGERIRTSDPLVPNQLRYQAALLAEILLFEFLVQFVKVVVRGGLEPHVRKNTNT